jgi:hypothetical protein
MTVLTFPRYRGAIIEIDSVTLMFKSDGSLYDGFVVRILNHPKTGDFDYWHGLFFSLAMLEAQELLDLMPGAVLQVVSDDDPNGGDKIPVDIAA